MEEIDLIKKYIEVYLSMPFDTRLDGYAFEKILADTKGIKNYKRSWNFFDIIDENKKIGWSVKSKSRAGLKLEINHKVSIQINGIIRTDNSKSAQEIGTECLNSWNNILKENLEKNNLKEGNFAILISNKNSTKFAYFEKKVKNYDPNKFVWKESISKTGVNRYIGCYKGKTYTKFYWNPEKNQLFEYWVIPKNAKFFEINVKKRTWKSLIGEPVKLPALQYI